MDHNHDNMVMDTTTTTTMADPHAGHIMGTTTTADPHAGHIMGTTTTANPHAGHNMGSMDNSSMGHMMQMFFHTGDTEYILFEPLLTSNAGNMFGACVAVFALSVLYEGLKYFREFLLRRFALASRQEAYTPSTISNGDVISKQPEIGTRMLSGSHGLQTLLHMVQVFISYCLMLIFMTYNVYLCVAIILGAGLGYFIFGWRRAMVVDMNEHCH